MHDHGASALSSDGVPVKGCEAFGLALRDARKLDIASAAGNLVKSMVLFYSMPEHQAFLAGAFLTAAATSRMRPVPSFIATFIGGLAAEKAYLTMRDVRLGALEIQAVGKALKATTDLNVNGPDPAQP